MLFLRSVLTGCLSMVQRQNLLRFPSARREESMHSEDMDTAMKQAHT